MCIFLRLDVSQKQEGDSVKSRPLPSSDEEGLSESAPAYGR